MKAVYLLSLVTFVAGISADRVLLAGSTDKYGIVGAISTGNGSAAVTGFVSAGRAVDTTGAVTALVQIFDNRMYRRLGFDLIGCVLRIIHSAGLAILAISLSLRASGSFTVARLNAGAESGDLRADTYCDLAFAHYIQI